MLAFDTASLITNVTLAVIGVSLLIFSLVKWRAGCILLLIAICFEGIAVKYLPLPRSFILMFKGLWVVPIYLGFFLECKINGKEIIFDVPTTVMILMMAWIAFIQLFNPNLPSFKIGLVGLGIFFTFVPMYLIGYHIFEDKEQLFSLFTLLGAVSIPITILGIIQSVEGGSGLISNWTIPGRAAFWGGGSTGIRYYKSNSTFTFISQFGQYLHFIIIMLFALTFITFRMHRRIILSVAFVLAVLVLILMNALITWVAIVFGFLIMFILSRKSPKRLYRFALPVVLVFVICLLWPMARTVFIDRGNRLIEALPIRIRGAFLNPMSVEAPFIGLGPGMGSSGVSYFAPQYVTGLGDSFIRKLILEYGIPGLAIFGILLIVFIIRGYKSVKSLNDADMRWIGIGLFAYEMIVAALIVVPGLEFTPTNVYFWFFTGLLMKLPQIESTAIEIQSEES